jgi:hypothetical protein
MCGLIRFAKYITPDAFSRLATLMNELPPSLVITINRARAAAIRSGDGEAVRANVELILNGSPTDRPLFDQVSSVA